MQHSNATQNVLTIFHEISQIPRRSKEEEKIAQYLYEWAEKHGFKAVKDKANNIIIYVDATEGYENAPTIVLQGHMDMVCEKIPTSNHDFTKDPIKIVEKDGWMMADGTSLGADNGLGVAMAMALAIDKDAEHPALELLITSDEETGMTGAQALSTTHIKGRIMLNLDSEDEGVFTVGCAGGRDTRSTVLLYDANVPKNWVRTHIHVGGLTGGHSGVDIALGRANAIRLAARLLRALYVAAPEILLQDIKGGSAHNAIPRDAEFVIAGPEAVTPLITKAVSQMLEIFRKEYAGTDPDIDITVESGANTVLEAIDRSSSEKVADLLLTFPHGVCSVTHADPTLVESSVNMAVVHIDNNKLKLISSQRSSVASVLDAVTARVEANVRLANGIAISGKGYPAWQPDFDSEVLARSKKVYAERFGKEPVIEVIHAGLECGIIGAKFPTMDMISFGPTIRSPHSPQERAEIATIEMVYDFMKDLLRTYKP